MPFGAMIYGIKVAVVLILVLTIIYTFDVVQMLRAKWSSEIGLNVRKRNDPTQIVAVGLS